LEAEELARYKEILRRVEEREPRATESEVNRLLTGLAEDPKLIKKEDILFFRTGVKGGEQLALLKDTHAPTGRVKENINGLKLEQERPCPWCKRLTGKVVCPGCGRPVVDAEYLTKKKLDDLPFGVIRLGIDGTILAFNRAEEEMARVSHKKIIGKNFFTEVVTCTDVKKFRSRYSKFLAGRAKSEDFEITYPFSFGAVHVTLIFFRESRHVGYVVTSKQTTVSKTGTSD
jgi:photoactive yellow protein